MELKNVFIDAEKSLETSLLPELAGKPAAYKWRQTCSYIKNLQPVFGYPARR